MHDIRQPAVAGQFYPADEEKLQQQMDSFLEQAEAPEVKGGIRALMVPHAGYDFSGPVAASAYKHLQGRDIRHVYLLGNSHSSFFEGVAVDDSSAWKTPLGRVEIDQETAARLKEASPVISINEVPHQREHSLEVQLPFLQTVIKREDFRIIPILFGNTAEGDEYRQLARAIADNLGERDVVILSSDMSHFPPYEEANRIDKRTLEVIVGGDIEELEEHISEVMEQGIPNEDTLLCGEDAVKTGMELSRLLGWDNVKQLKYANSGDTPIMDKDKVVGYGAVAFADSTSKEEEAQQDTRTRPLSRGGEAEKEGDIENPLTAEQKQTLLNVARETVETYMRTGKRPKFNITEEKLQETEGAFVTLKRNGELRGCIGKIVQAEDPLWKVVRDVAVDAAVNDDRFPPVTEEELPSLTYEVSVLSVPRPVDDWRKVNPGEHGAIIRKNGKSGVFLPQVARETGWNREEFLGQLCLQKLGLPPQTYKDPDAEIYIFTAQVFGEE